MSQLVFIATTLAIIMSALTFAVIKSAPVALKVVGALLLLFATNSLADLLRLSDVVKITILGIIAAEIFVLFTLFVTIPCSKIRKKAGEILGTKDIFSDEVKAISRVLDFFLEEVSEREKEIAYRNKLLYNLSLISGKLSIERDKKRILLEIVNGVEWTLDDSKALLWVYDEKSFIDKHDEMAKSMLESGELEAEHEGEFLLGYVLESDGRKYGVLIAKKRTLFIPAEREFLYSLAKVGSSLLQRAEFEKKLEIMSITDPLTGIYNRRFFMETLNNEILKLRRLGGVISVVLFDLDFFKMVNDEFGHLTGDEVLKSFAKTLRINIRGYDVPARYGGDEFILLLVRTDKEVAKIIAERVVSTFQRTDDYPSFVPRLLVSCGIADSNESESIDGILRLADSRMYKAKASREQKIFF